MLQSALDHLNLNYITPLASMELSSGLSLFVVENPVLFQVLSFIKSAIIYTNLTISLMIFVPYFALVACDFVVYVIRLISDSFQFMTQYTTETLSGLSTVPSPKGGNSKVKQL